MKVFELISLLVIASATTACANKAVKPQETPSQAVVQPVPAAIDSAPAVALSTRVNDSDVEAIADNATNLHTPESAALRQNTSTAAADELTALDDIDASYDKPPVRDPWERFNRKMHGFNSVVDRFVLRPIAVGYDKVMPDPVQHGVSRFFANLRTPATAFNQALQGHPGRAATSLGRFVVNTTVGVAGVFDPASRFRIPKRDDEDFGQTLATWGWRDSRYLVLPLLGPRTVRDTVALAADQPLSPTSKIEDSGVANGLQLLQMVDGRAQMLVMDKARSEALDDYAFVRDSWAQRRNYQIEQDLKNKHN